MTKSTESLKDTDFRPQTAMHGRLWNFLRADAIEILSTSFITTLMSAGTGTVETTNESSMMTLAPGYVL